MRFLIRKDSVTHMAYHHLTLHELVMVETYWSMRVPVNRIAQRMRRGRQTIYRVIHAFDRGMTALEYYHEYKKHRYHCGRKRVRLRAQYVHLITCFLHQGLSFDVISGLFPRMLPCSSRTLYRLAHTGVFPKQSLPWKGKRHKNGVKDKEADATHFVVLLLIERTRILDLIPSLVILKDTLLLEQTITAVCSLSRKDKRKLSSRSILMGVLPKILKTRLTRGYRVCQKIS